MTFCHLKGVQQLRPGRQQRCAGPSVAPAACARPTVRRKILEAISRRSPAAACVHAVPAIQWSGICSSRCWRLQQAWPHRAPALKQRLLAQPAVMPLWGMACPCGPPSGAGAERRGIRILAHVKAGGVRGKRGEAGGDPALTGEGQAGWSRQWRPPLRHVGGACVMRRRHALASALGTPIPLPPSTIYSTRHTTAPALLAGVPV